MVTRCLPPDNGLRLPHLVHVGVNSTRAHLFISEDVSSFNMPDLVPGDGDHSTSAVFRRMLYLKGDL